MLAALLLACTSSPEVPAEAPTDAPTEAPAEVGEPSPPPRSARTPAPGKQLVRSRDGAVVEVGLTEPWGPLQLPMHDGTIRRVTPSLLVVSLGPDHLDPIGRAREWCVRINERGGTCGPSDPSLPADGFDAPVTLGGEGKRLKVVKMMGDWTLMITPPPPTAPRGAD